jgi:hypothetical protein
MRNSPEPSIHRQHERQFIEHVERLLSDERLRVDTVRGRRPVTAFSQSVQRSDNAVAIKRMMSEVGLPDRELEAQMPQGHTLDVTLSQSKMLIFKQMVGRLKVQCISPSRALLGGGEISPLNKQGVEAALGTTPPGGHPVPTTLVLFSTSGFTREAHELAERRADRTLILVQPNDAGGFSAVGPVETQSLTDLFDPEGDEQKRSRVRSAIDELKSELSGSGIASDKLATRTELPIQFIESEVKAYARGAGLVAKRLDGRVVLFREGSVPQGASGGSDMPMIDRLKALFSKKGEHERKIAFLSERRAALGQQRDRIYEEIESAEKRDADLRSQFKSATSELAKRRVTSQLLQLRKDTDRRQQHLGVLNQQMNVVSTHLHNLELVQQGKTAQLPNSEEMASDAAAAEEMLANLQADAELAESVSGVSAGAGMSEEEQALFAELEGETAQQSAAEATDEPAASPKASQPARQRSEPDAG